MCYLCFHRNWFFQEVPTVTVQSDRLPSYGGCSVKGPCSAYGNLHVLHPKLSA